MKFENSDTTTDCKYQAAGGQSGGAVRLRWAARTNSTKPLEERIMKTSNFKNNTGSPTIPKLGSPIELGSDVRLLLLPSINWASKQASKLELSQSSSHDVCYQGLLPQESEQPGFVAFHHDRLKPSHHHFYFLSWHFLKFSDIFPLLYLLPL